MVKDWRIGILTLQETHLDETSLDRIEALYGRTWRIVVVNSADPDELTRARGIAIVMNREIIDTNGIHSIEII